MAGVLNRHHAIVPNHDHTVLQNMYKKNNQVQIKQRLHQIESNCETINEKFKLMRGSQKFKYSLHSPSVIDEYQKTK